MATSTLLLMLIKNIYMHMYVWSAFSPLQTFSIGTKLKYPSTQWAGGITITHTEFCMNYREREPELIAYEYCLAQAESEILFRYDF